MILRRTIFITLFVLLNSITIFAGQQQDAIDFDDTPLTNAIQYPSWFKLSFLDLREDIQEVSSNKKKALILYFGQYYCAYCNQLIQVNFGQPDIEKYTKKYFDIIPINIRGQEKVIDFNGLVTNEKQLSQTLSTDFTPTLIFYDLNGKAIFRLRGYYPPYQFKAALEFIVGDYYQSETFSEYLERGSPGLAFEADELNAEDFFLPPPHNLSRNILVSDRSLAVFFEQGRCHACDILHGGPLMNREVQAMLQKIDSAQLHVWKNTPIMTPEGKKTTTKQWVDELNLFYTPSILFYDETGHEIIRLDSVAQLYRIKSVLKYIVSGAYHQEPNYIRWRLKN